MHGRDLGVNSDDLEVMEAVQETKQEVLENKDVRFVKLVLSYFLNILYLYNLMYYKCQGACIW